MATDRQIEANRKNAQRSTGPSSTEGKLQSRLNATKHGMAAQLPEIEAAFSPEFEERRARWAAEQNPVGEEGHFALDRVVAATFRIERCERTFDHVTEEVQQRARLAWDQDRAVEAATILERISKIPVLASRQLQTTFAGVCLLIEAWLGLAAALENGDWSESEASKALDLFGVDLDLRSGQTLIDTPEGADPVAFRRELVMEEVERLEQLRDEALAPLDEMERRGAMTGARAMLSKPAKLILRYERDAWKRYRESLKEVKLSTTVVEVAPPIVIVEPPKAAPVVLDPVDPLEAIDLEFDEDAWLDRLEKRIEALPTRGPGRPFATERTQFVDFAIGQTP